MNGHVHWPTQPDWKYKPKSKPNKVPLIISLKYCLHCRQSDSGGLTVYFGNISLSSYGYRIDIIIIESFFFWGVDNIRVWDRKIKNHWQSDQEFRKSIFDLFTHRKTVNEYSCAWNHPRIFGRFHPAAFKFVQFGNIQKVLIMVTNWKLTPSPGSAFQAKHSSSAVSNQGKEGGLRSILLVYINKSLTS